MVGKPKPPVNCKVLRPFLYKGEILQPGKILEFPFIFANEMRTANKVEFLPDKAIDPVEESKATETAEEEAPKRGRKKKNKD